MRAIKHILLFCSLLLATMPGHAQYRNFEKAYKLFQEKKLDSARIFIDSAAVNTQTEKDIQVWLVRGFIYKELYKQKESNNVNSPLREVAVQSFKVFMKLDSGGTNNQREIVVKSLKYQAATYHNDIAKTLDTVNYQQSLKNAEKHKELMKYLDPTFDEKSYDYDIFLILGSMFEKDYESTDSKNLLDLAKVYLFKAYEIKNNTFSVNKNIGFLYYNQAVSIIKKMDYDIPLDQLPVYQDQSVKLGQQALSYCLKAHELNPEDRAVTEALAGIYYLLNDNEKHNEFKKKLGQ
ncbi:MAG: hypothetical protein ACXVPN_13695 [Bacteroidia bacterium]